MDRGPALLHAGASGPFAAQSDARTYTEDAIAALVSIVNDPKANASARISAANSLLDRGHGTPPHAVNNDTFVRLWRYLTVGEIVGRAKGCHRLGRHRGHAKNRSRLLGNCDPNDWDGRPQQRTTTDYQQVPSNSACVATLKRNNRSGTDRSVRVVLANSCMSNLVFPG